MEENKQITELTEEQKAKIPEYRERFRQIAISTEPTNKAKAEAAILRSCEYLHKKDPSHDKVVEFVWADDPIAGAKLAAGYAKGDADVTQEEVRAQAELASYGSFEAYWVSTYSFIANELPVEKDDLHEIVTDIVKECGVFWKFKGLFVMTPKPCEIHMKEDKLHNTEGMAIRYANGTGIYAYNGERKGSLMEVVMASRNQA